MTGWLEEAFKAIFGAKLPDGSQGVAAGVTMTLGSGYSVDAERAGRIMQLRAACDKARFNPSWRPNQPQAGNTHCNGNADEVAQSFGYMKLIGLMADVQIAVLAADPDWTMDSAERFIEHVRKGGLAFATVIEHPHGHLAPGYPDAPQASTLWGELEPMVSNVGESVGVMRLSDAFLLRQKPLIRFYLYKTGEVT